jgi:hypothetical protein
VNLDRQSIERRDFPIGRRGYEPAAVDTHLRTLATEVSELERSLGERNGESLGSAAGSQVQSILEAAETTAADIERQAAEAAATAREEAASDAERTRDEAVARAQAHAQAVGQATAALLERIESMDQEVDALVQSLRAGAGRLVSDLQALETNMGELYDAASDGAAAAGAESSVGVGAIGGGTAATRSPSVGGGGTGPAGMPTAANGGSEHVLQASAVPRAPSPSISASAAAAAAPTAPMAVSSGSAAAPISTSAADSGGASSDIDGARLIALNMALNGEPREQADRYLAEHFELSDREKLLDEVYTAIEG